MDQTVRNLPETPDRPSTPTPAGVPGILWNSALQALPKAVVALVLGNLAVGLVGHLWHEMAPSPPPGITGKLLSEAAPSISTRAWWPSIREHQFAIVYSIFFVNAVWMGLFGRLLPVEEEPRESMAQRIGRRPSGEWFGLIVGNAFGALFSAIAVFWVKQFSLNQLLWHALLQPVFVQAQAAASKLLGGAVAGSVQDWITWYSANQFKFYFWLLYIAAICDDLGIPNLKTFGRWLWRKVRKKLSLGAKPAV